MVVSGLNANIEAVTDTTGAYTLAYGLLVATWLVCAALTYVVPPMKHHEAQPARVDPNPAE